MWSLIFFEFLLNVKKVWLDDMESVYWLLSMYLSVSLKFWFDMLMLLNVKVVFWYFNDVEV